MGQDHDELVRPMMTFLGPVGKSPPHLLRSEPTSRPRPEGPPCRTAAVDPSAEHLILKSRDFIPIMKKTTT